MRNVWKGLVVGGLTGIAAGVVLDAVARASKRAVELGAQVRGHAPEAGRVVQSLTEKASEWVRDANGPERLRDAAQRVKESDTAERVAQISRDALSGAIEAASSLS